MIQIFLAPQSRPDFLTLRATRENWGLMIDRLVSVGYGPMADPISGALVNSNASVIPIDFPENTARQILRHAGLSA